MTMRAAIALLVLAAGAPAWAAKLETVAPQCAAIGAEITVSGKGLRKLAFSVGGVGTLVTKRSRTQATILVPSGVPSGATTIEAERGKKRITVPFVVKGEELCDGVDNDCNGLVDDIVQDDRARCENGRLLLGRRGAATSLDACVPGTIEACYTGPEDTEGVGLCHAGARVCSLDGVWGRCDGEVVPGEEDPGNGIDEDCNGRDGPGGGELCIPGTLRTCYSGPPATRDVGPCHAGARMCDDGGFFGPCENEVVPVSDIPGNDIDENCDGGDGQRAPILDIVVNPVLTPTFQTSQVLTGTVGTELASVPEPPPPPLVASVSPSTGRQGQSLTVTVTGQNSAFADGTTQVSFGGGISVTGLAVTSPSTVSVQIRIAPDANIGPRVVAVATNRQEAIASNAFSVQPADAGVSGKITDASGAPVAGATVCVSGTAICTTTAADGTFTLPTVPTNATRLIVAKTGLGEFSIAIGDRSSDVDVGLLAFEDTGEPQPPPPQSGAPPLDAAIASVVARLNTTQPELLTPEQARKTVQDFIRLVGGDELGVLDAQGAQLNTEITGTGPLSIQDAGVDALARGFLQGATTTFEEFVFSLGLTFQWTAAPPDVDVMLARFQQAVDAAWADPDAPESALMIALFNPGPVFAKDPPRLSRVTRINRVGTTVMLAGFLIEGLQQQTGRGPSGPTRLAFRTDVVSDAPIVLAQADPPPVRSYRQLTRSMPDADAYVSAINQSIIETLAFTIPAAIASGTLGVMTLVTAAVGEVADFFLFQVLQRVLTAKLAPTPPGIVRVVSDGNVVRITVRRTEKDNAAFAQQAGAQLSRFNYTVYRGCQRGGTKIVIANLSVPFSRDGAPGEFEVVDKRPVPGLNCYYADVIQNVGIQVPPALEFATGAMSVPTKIAIPVGNVVSLFFISNLLSDFSVPSPFPMPGQPGANNVRAPTDDELNSSRTVWLPPIGEAYLGPYGFVDAIRADDAGNYYVSDSNGQTITKTLPSRERQPYAVTGFNGPQIGLAIDPQASLYTENVESEARFSGRTFKFAQPDGAKKFTGTVDKYSPLLDRGNEVSVSALAIGPGINAAGLGDLFATENFHRRIRRLPTSIIPPAGIEALPAPGGGIFGPLAASPIVGFPYVDFPTCEQGYIADIDFDRDGTLFAVTDSSLYAVPFDTGSGGAGERRTVAQLGCGDGGVQVEVTGPETLGAGATRSFTATGTPCTGTLTWSTNDQSILEVGLPEGSKDGVGRVNVRGKAQGRAKLIATYETAQGTATGELEIFVGGPFIFFHGIGGTAKNWDDLRDFLTRPDQMGAAAFGGELCDSTFGPMPTIPAGRTCATAPMPPPAFMYTYNFRNSVDNFITQGDEVARVIERVKAANHVDKVTIVGFSMGGVSVRAYVENLAPTKPYANDVAAVYTINTPHKGSPWPNLTQVPIVTFFLDTAQDIIDANAAFYGGALRDLRAALPPPRANDNGLIQLNFNSPALNTLNSPAHRPPADIKFTNVIAKSAPDVAFNLCFFVANGLDFYAGDYSNVVPTIAPFNLCHFFENSDLVVGTDSQDLESIFPGIGTTIRRTGHHNNIPPVPPNDVPFMLDLLGLTG